MFVRLNLFRLVCFLCTILDIGNVFGQTHTDSVKEEVFVWVRNPNEENINRLSDVFKELLHSSQVQFERAFLLQEEPFHRIFILKSSDNIDLKNLLASEIVLELTELLEVVPKYQFFYTPNDLHSAQWQLSKIMASKAWDISRGVDSIIICLVDDGIDTAHEDLNACIWHNKKEIPNNFIDDDKNGYVDDIYGWDLADKDNDPNVTVSNGLSHGTHCAGIMAATTSNNKGIASIGFGLKIMPIKCGKDFLPFLFDPYKGVEYAIINKANIISMSWGGGAYSTTYQALFDLAFKNNIFCVAAAGNSSSNTKMYPAAYNYVFSVGSTQNADKISSFSNYGSWVDVMAPGESIYSTLPGNGYGIKSGTSMACPLVSGLAGIMLSRNPKITITEIENCIKSGCDNIDILNPSYKGQLGAGRINAYQTINCVKKISADFKSSKKQLCPGDSVKFFGFQPGNITNFKWKFPGGNPSSSTVQNPIVKYTTAGIYSISLWVSDGKEVDSITFTNLISVNIPELKFYGKQTIMAGEFATVTGTFTGEGPVKVIYTDGFTKDTVKDLLSSPFYFLEQCNKNTVFKPVEIERNGCIGAVKDSMVVQISNAQTTNICDSAIRFQMSIGGPGADYAQSVIKENDSLFVVVGITNSYGSGQQDAFITKVSRTGDIKWFKTYGSYENEGFFTVCKDAKNNFYAAGYAHNNTNRAIIIAKYNNGGKLIWERKFGGTSTDYSYTLQVLKDGQNLLLSGLGISVTHGSEDYLIIKLDTNGTVIYSTVLGNADLNRLHHSVELKDGSLVLTGATGNSYPDVAIACVKINKSGTLMWQRQIDKANSTTNITGHRILNWEDKYFYVSGFIGDFSGSTYSSRNFHLTKLNALGYPVWAYEYALGINYHVWDSYIFEKNIYLCGYNSQKNGDGFIVKIDSNGNILNYQLIGSTANEIINSFDIGPSGDIVYTGGITNTNQDILIGNLNCKMKGYCNTAAAVLSRTSFTTDVQSPGFTSKTFGVIANFSLTDMNINPTKKIICISRPNVMKKKCVLQARFNYSGKCIADSFKFVNISKDSVYQMESSNWFIDNTQFSSNFNAISYKFNKEGWHNVQLVVKSTLDNFSCLDTWKERIFVKSKFELENPISDLTICIGDSMPVKTPKTICGVAPYIYKWTDELGKTYSNIMNPYFNPKKNSKYYLEIWDNNSGYLKDSMTVFVKQNCCISKARIGMQKFDFCLGDSVSLQNISTYKKNAIFTWYLPEQILSKFIGLKPPRLVFSTVGKKSGMLVLFDSCKKEDTAFFEFMIHEKPKYEISRDTNICFPDTLNLLMNISYRASVKWTPAVGLSNPYIENPVAIVSKPSSFYCEVEDEYGCKIRDSIIIGSVNKYVDLGPDVHICEGESTILKNKITLNNYLWSDGSSKNQLMVSKAGTYWLNTKFTSCDVADTISVFIDSMPRFTLGPDTSICKFPYTLQPRNLLIKQVSALWENGNNNHSRNISGAGNYFLNLKKGKCSFSDTIKIDSLFLPKLELNGDTILCNSDSVLIALPFPKNYTAFHDNSIINGNAINLKIGGLHIFEIRNQCGHNKDSMTIISEDCRCKVFVPNSFTPNHSKSINDVFKIETICKFNYFEVDIYNQWGAKIFHSNKSDFEWDGKYQGKPVENGKFVVVLTMQNKYTNHGSVFKQVGYLYVEE